jgi:hypothetical protein
MENLLIDSSELEKSVQENSEKSDEIEELQNDHEANIHKTKEQVDQSKLEVSKTEKEIVKITRRLEKVVQEISEYKELDIKTLKRLEKRLEAAENEWMELELEKRVQKLMLMKSEQESLMKVYREEVSVLEQEVGRMKVVAESVDNLGCFRRQRLEP